MEKVVFFKTKDGNLFEDEVKAKQHEAETFVISCFDKMITKFGKVVTGKDLFDLLVNNLNMVKTNLNLLGEYGHE